MEEKKLTDEEIVTALEICKSSKSCRKETGCPLRDCINCHTELAKRVLDLIHRLQSENKSLREIAIGATETQGLNIELLQKNAEQKEEIKAMKVYLSILLQMQGDEIKKRIEIVRKLCRQKGIVYIPELSDDYIPGGPKGDKGERGVCARSYDCEDLQKAVKETAKEIYEIADNTWTGSQNDGVNILVAIKEFCKSKGVEVE